ncbi:acyl-CoA N-acyltransferase [Rostrohypoxylon terebratum]|nr:acyl-CoA N-acyltransferase [Rostrohypoxylon terebratum]
MEASWVLVKTSSPSLPLPPNSQREPIRTKRLVIRPMREDDLQTYHELRSQPEAMTGTSRGTPDKNIVESRLAMRDFLPLSDKCRFLFGVFLASTGELIGEGGVHNLKSPHCGWPEIGYKFKREFWGHGFATEFLDAFLKAWWKLPRIQAERRVCPSSLRNLKDHQPVAVAEQVYACAEVNNKRSRRVLEKVGFVQFSEWTEPDVQEHRIGQSVTLVGYSLCKKTVAFEISSNGQS